MGSESAVGGFARSDAEDVCARRWPLCCALLLCALLCAALLSSETASALTQKGHVLGSPFGSPGAGDGQFNQPGAIAVNEATGDIYVVDRANSRIERLGEKGEFIAAWGFGVTDGAQKFEVCTSKCKAGTGKGGLISPGAIAVDNSSGPSKGDVYVVMDSRAKHGNLWKLGPNGEKTKQGVLTQEGVKPGTWEGALDGVSVDGSGAVWVYRAETVEAGVIEEFNGEAENKFTTNHEFEAKPTSGSAVLTEVTSYAGLSAGKTLVGADIPEGTTVAEVTEEQKGKKELTMSAPATASPGKEKIKAVGEGLRLEPALEGELLEANHEAESPFCPKPGFAVDAAGEHLYVDHERINTEAGCPEQTRDEEVAKKEPPKETLLPVVAAKFKLNGEELLEGLLGAVDTHNTAGVAVDLASTASTPLGEAARGDVYLATGTTVAAYDSGGTPLQSIRLAGATPQSAGVAVDAKTGVLYATDAAAGQVDVFPPASPGKPTVNSVLAQVLSPTSARVTALIDPMGADTHAFIQYGTASCVAEPAGCTEVPLQPEDLGAGFGDVSAAVELTGLQPDTTYYFRVLARNVNGTGESSQSAQTFFTTLPSPKGLLADHRAWELVSPPDKGGSLIEAITELGGDIQASADGSGITYVSAGPVGKAEGNRTFVFSQLLSNRGESEWSTQDIATPHTTGEGFLSAHTPEYRIFSPDLSLSVVEPEISLVEPEKPSERLAAPPLSPPLSEEERGHQERTIYLRDNPPFTPGPEQAAMFQEAKRNSEYLAPGYFPLLTQASDTAKSAFGKSLNFQDASPNLSHAVFQSQVPLTPNAVGSSVQSLYEWNASSPASIQLLSVLPRSKEEEVKGEEKPANEPRLGASDNTRNAISSDGTRIFWTDGEEEGQGFLYMRDSATAKTIQINVAQGERVEPTPAQRAEFDGEARFQTASSDGMKVFFQDTWPLTDNSRLHPAGRESPADLYEYNVETSKVSDLTPSQHAGESADVLGTIPGAGADGQNVYFVANGVLAAGALPGHCAKTNAAPTGATCNLYVSAPDPANPGQRQTKLIAVLSAEDLGDWGGSAVEINQRPASNLAYLTSRVSPNGRYLAFMSNRELTGYNNVDVNPEAKGAHDEEVFLYDLNNGRLLCASCNPSGARPHGVFDTETAGEGQGLLVDRRLIWGGGSAGDHWLAGSIPGWTGLAGEGRFPTAIYQSRYLSNNGRLFFNSADALVAQDENSKEDVYQYESNGLGSCTNSSGCVTLISSGAASDKRESAFLDASESANDVFFLTSQSLLPQDVDTTFDVYDARVCGTPESSACLPAKPPPPPECVGEGCKLPAPEQPVFGSARTTLPGPGNTTTTTKGGVLNSKTAPHSPSLHDRLVKALKTCRKKYKTKRGKRVACERRERKKYAALSKKAKRSTRASATAGRRGK